MVRKVLDVTLQQLAEVGEVPEVARVEREGGCGRGGGRWPAGYAPLAKRRRREAERPGVPERSGRRAVKSGSGAYLYGRAPIGR